MDAERGKIIRDHVSTHSAKAATCAFESIGYICGRLDYTALIVY